MMKYVLFTLVWLYLRLQGFGGQVSKRYGSFQYLRLWDPHPIRPVHLYVPRFFLPLLKLQQTLHPDATLLLLSTQSTFILTFFLSRNLRIARDRVWDQTLRSRGKGPEFWKPYVEERDTPPVVKGSGLGFAGLMSSFPGRWAVKCEYKVICSGIRDGMLSVYG